MRAFLELSGYAEKSYAVITEFIEIFDPSLFNQMTDGHFSVDKNRLAGYFRHSNNGKIIGSVFTIVKNGSELRSWFVNSKGSHYS